MGDATEIPPFPGTIPPPAGVIPNLSYSQSKYNLATNILCITITTMFVAVRLYTKHFVLRRIDASDYASFAAWATFMLYQGISLKLGVLGLGIHMWNLPPLRVVEFFEYGYVTEVMYGPVIFLTKLAILLLFIRLFEVERRFVTMLKVLIWILSAYYFAITAAKIFICWPIPKFWNPRLPGRCLNSNTVFISDCIIAIVTDCLILCAPLAIIWKLQMSVKQKVGSSFVLVAGGFACIASIIRLQYALHTLHNIDKTYIFLPILLWSSCEISIGIICGCLPVVPALFRYMKTRRQTTHGSCEPMFEDSHTFGSEGRPLQVLPSLTSTVAEEELHITTIKSSKSSK